MTKPKITTQEPIIAIKDIKNSGSGNYPKTQSHSKQNSNIPTNALQPNTESENLKSANDEKNKISAIIDKLKSKPIFYFKEIEKDDRKLIEAVKEEQKNHATLGYEIDLQKINDFKNNIIICKIYQKRTQDIFPKSLMAEGEAKKAKKELLEKFKETENGKEFINKISQNQVSKNKNIANQHSQSLEIENRDIIESLNKIQDYIDKAFEENEIKTQEDLLFYVELITKIEDLLKSPVATDSQNSPKGNKVLTSSASKASLENQNKKDSFTENNDKFCQFLSEKVLLNNDHSNVEALQPYNISNKPFIIEGNTFFLSKQQIKYLTEIKSLVLTKKSSEFKREPVIINGVPGSGKSYLTKLITEKSENLQRLLEQIDKKPIGQLKYQAKELNYCEFYNYQAGKVTAKTNEKIKDIIDNKINNIGAGKKLFLMVDEWGVMYPPYTTEYLKTIQQTNENVVIIGVTANLEPIKALLDSAHKTLSNGDNYKDHNIISEEIFNDKSQPAGTITGINYNHIVDFTTEINSSALLEGYIRNNSSIISDNSYVICNYKDQADQKNYFFICKKENGKITKISKSTNIGGTKQDCYAFDQKELLNLLKTDCNSNNFNLIASQSTARGADFNEIIKAINNGWATTQHNYYIIVNEIFNAGSPINAMANIAQALQRARLLTSNQLTDGNIPNNHHIEIYKREAEGVAKYDKTTLIKTATENNNFFQLAKTIDFSKCETLLKDISKVDLETLESEIKKCENIEKYQTIKSTIDFIEFLSKELPLKFNKEKSVKELISKNKEEKEFSEYYLLARASPSLEHESYKKAPECKIKDEDGKDIEIKRFFIKDFNNKDDYKILAEEISTDNAIMNQCPRQDFVEFNVKNGKIVGYDNQSSSLPQNLPEQQNSWSCGKIAVVTGILGGIGYGIDCISTSSSAGASSGGSLTIATPQINPFIQADGNALLSDLHSHLKPINYIENHYNVKNIAINHHQHSTSLIGKSNLSIGHLGATKTVHLSLASSTASKVGLATKAGLLAGAFTPFLAIAGIGAVGYLGYKAYEYFYKNENKENFVQNNKKDLDKLSFYQKNSQEIFKENKKKPSVLLNPNNIEKLHHSTLTI